MTKKNATAGVQRKTMTVENWLDVKSAFAALDNCQGLGLANLTIAKTMNRIDAALKDYEDGRRRLVNEISGGTGTIHPNEAEKYKRYNEAHSVMVKEEVSADIFPLKVSQLNLAHNSVTPSALAKLIGIDALIDDSDEVPAAAA